MGPLFDRLLSKVVGKTSITILHWWFLYNTETLPTFAVACRNQPKQSIKWSDSWRHSWRLQRLCTVL